MSWPFNGTEIRYPGRRSSKQMLNQSPQRATHLTVPRCALRLSLVNTANVPDLTESVFHETTYTTFIVSRATGRSVLEIAEFYGRNGG